MTHSRAPRQTLKVFEQDIPHIFGGAGIIHGDVLDNVEHILQPALASR